MYFTPAALKSWLAVLNTFYFSLNNCFCFIDTPDQNYGLLLELAKALQEPEQHSDWPSSNLVEKENYSDNDVDDPSLDYNEIEHKLSFLENEYILLRSSENIVESQLIKDLQKIINELNSMYIPPGLVQRRSEIIRDISECQELYQ